MKVIISVLLFFSSALLCHAESTLEYDTPFTIEYRKRYEANNVNLMPMVSYAFQECKKRCTPKDIQAMKKLAESGDMFSIAMAHFYSDPNLTFEQITKKCADKGEHFYTIIYSARLAAKNNVLDAETYATVSVKKGYVRGYEHLARTYEQSGQIEKACNIISQGHDKFGLEFLSLYFIRNDLSYQSQCTSNSEMDKIINSSEEGLLIKGYRDIANNMYSDAYKKFEKIYVSSSASVKVKANAGYCLGMMNYYGKGVKKSEKKGLELLKESHQLGIFYNETPTYNTMPDVYEIISYYGGNCNFIK